MEALNNVKCTQKNEKVFKKNLTKSKHTYRHHHHHILNVAETDELTKKSNKCRSS